LSRNESGRFGALKSDSTHHFFRNACTKSGSLRFSQLLEQNSTKLSEVNVKDTFTSHIDRKIFGKFLLTTLPYIHEKILIINYNSLLAQLTPNIGSKATSKQKINQTHTQTTIIIHKQTKRLFHNITINN
jgi:hypothetical protein